MPQPSYRKTKYTCFYTYLAMSSVFCLSPLLLTTFHSAYDISYTLLGTLVLINFCTQLVVDLVFSFLPKLFNVSKTLRIMPLLTSLGLIIYAAVPTFVPQFAYVGLAVGTVIFSAASGLCEVLLSPTVAAIPDSTDRDMSRLHSLYAYGVLSVVIVSTLLLKLIGTQNWQYLILMWALPPLVSHFLYCTSPIPEINHSEQKDKSTAKHSLGFVLCLLCIFFGAASENVMTNWVSGYIESVFTISKTAADLLGLAAFSVLLGLARTLYAHFGKNISLVLMLGMIGAAVCYIIAGVSINIYVSLVACMFTGFATSMLWPGTLIYMENRFPALGVTAYALMAAGGDMGTSIAPQLMGVAVDAVSATDIAKNIGTSLHLSAEQIGMRSGMLLSALFPIIGIAVVLLMRKDEKQNASKKDT